MSHQDVDTVRGIYEAFGRGDMPAITELLHEDVEWDSPETLPWGGFERGHDRVLAFFGRVDDAVEELTAAPKSFHQSGDRVIVEGTHTGRSNQGRPFTADWAMVWQLRDGKVVAWKEYVDTAAVTAAYSKAHA